MPLLPGNLQPDHNFMYRYYDIHTHSAKEQPADCFAIGNLYKNFEQTTTGKPYSVGLHPWYLSNSTNDLELVQRYATEDNVLAIGECGLDKICDTDWQLQTAIFIKQVALANHLQKPLIIHCVRAFEELTTILKEQQVAVPIIIHGYNKKATVADDLLSKGYYLSFGAAILNSESPAAKVLAQVPAKQFFLETDSADVAITDIYTAAAQIRKTDVETIILQVQQNFQNVFGI